MGTAERVQTLIEPLVVARGLELVDVEQTGATLRVVVDRSGGVDLDALGEVTRSVSLALDEADPIGGRYTLEVSSPGIERPLRKPDHFQRAVGETVAVKTMSEIGGERRFEGELVAADDRAIVVRTAVPGGEHRLTYDDIAKARTVVDWTPAPKPGKKAASR
jgi:ribosome maturation factor RimP